MACKNFTQCINYCSIVKSNITNDDPMRGNPNPKILMITECPDIESAKSGSAYSGSSGARMLSMLVEDNYGICLGDRSIDYRSNPVDFMNHYEIYRTSAIKCHVRRKDRIQELIQTCRDSTLKNQIEMMNQLKLIIPMGRIAISAIVGMMYDKVKPMKIVGSVYGTYQSGEYGCRVVALPHPSGSNIHFNPPIINSADKRYMVESKASFKKSLEVIRAELISHGFYLREYLPPPEEEIANGRLMV